MVDGPIVLYFFCLGNRQIKGGAGRDSFFAWPRPGFFAGSAEKFSKRTLQWVYGLLYYILRIVTLAFDLPAEIKRERGTREI